ncbi:MAG: sialate O-acetylesterase [Planctomycetota bacterium]
MKRTLFCKLFFVISALAASATAQIQSGLEYDVYFLAGQSNATGRGDAAELPTIEDGAFVAPQTDVQFYYRSTLTNSSGGINTTLPTDVFQPLQSGSGHGFNNPSSHPEEFGPEVSLGRTLADAYPDRNIAIIKYSHGGSNLHTQWDAGGDRYNDFLSVTSDALAAITDAGATFNLKGLGWVQGESDAGSFANASAYESNLTDFVDRVRTDVFGGTSAPFVISRLSDNQYNNLSTNVITIRNAQVAVAEADPMIEWVDTDDDSFSTYDIGNPIHFDARGNIAQGIAMGNGFMALTVQGDFNDDGVYDCADVDSLVDAIATNSADTGFDLTGDAVVDTADLTAWLAEAGNNNIGAPYLQGDANLDGVVDVSDFNTWNSNKFTTVAAWCAGDFNADGAIDVSDFNVWNSNKFQASDAATVPEPSGLTILISSLALILTRRRSR